MINYLARIEFLSFFDKHVHQTDLHNRFQELQHNFSSSFTIVYLFFRPGCLSCQTAATVTMAGPFWPTSTGPRTLSDRYEGNLIHYLSKRLMETLAGAKVLQVSLQQEREVGFCRKETDRIGKMDKMEIFFFISSSSDSRKAEPLVITAVGLATNVLTQCQLQFQRWSQKDPLRLLYMG